MATRICNDCGEEKTLNSDNFRKAKTKPKVQWEQMCKVCKSRQVRDHYRKWDRFDIEKRGPFGVKCVLWAPSCGNCDDAETCWRLDDIGESSEDYPEELPQ